MNTLVASISGIMLGMILCLLSGVKLKYTLVFALLICFPFFVKLTGSWRNALMAGLILSLSTQMSFNPFHSAYYVNKVLGVRISLTTMVLLLTYAYWLGGILLKKRKIKFHALPTLPFLLLVLWAGTTYFFAEKKDMVIFLLLQAIEGFLVYFYAANFIESEKDVRFIFKWAAVTVMITACIAIIQYFKPGFMNVKFMGWVDEPLKLYYGSKIISRPSAFLGHANNLAAFLICWLPLFFILIIGSKEKLYKNLLPIFTFILGSVALVLTFSRGGWISFVYAVLLILALFMRKEIRVKFPAFVPRIFVLGLVTLLMAAPFSSQIIKRLTRDDYSAGESRIRLAKNALELLAEQPVEGLGLGYYLDFKDIPPHNIYLHTAVELGMIGIFLFLYTSYGFFKKGFEALKGSHTFVLLFTIGILSGLSAAYLHGMVELGTIAFHKFLTYLFIGGLLVGLADFRKRMDLDGSA